MNDIKVLIIDDEEDMRELIRMYLENSRLVCLEAADGQEGLSILARENVDIIILDIMMPVMDGFTLCMKIRETSSVPIIFLTARAEEWDKVHGLKIGADDYIVKPFSPGELVARIEAVLRRMKKIEIEPEELQWFGPIEIDERGRKVLINGNAIPLTLKEFELLVYFCKHRGQALSREQLLENIWGFDYIGSERTVDTHIKTLRVKLGECGEYIQTVWGIGYKFEV